MSFIPNDALNSEAYEDGPLSPTIPDSQQLQAQLLASLQPRCSVSQWDKRDSSFQQSLALQNAQEKQSYGNFRSVESNQNDSVERNIDQASDSNTNVQESVISKLDNSKGESKRKSRSSKGKGQARSRIVKKSQKIKQLLSDRDQLENNKTTPVSIATKKTNLNTRNKTFETVSSTVGELNKTVTESQDFVTSSNINNTICQTEIRPVAVDSTTLQQSNLNMTNSCDFPAIQIPVHLLSLSRVPNVPVTTQSASAELLSMVQRHANVSNATQIKNAKPLSVLANPMNSLNNLKKANFQDSSLSQPTGIVNTRNKVVMAQPQLIPITMIQTGTSMVTRQGDQPGSCFNSIPGLIQQNNFSPLKLIQPNHPPAGMLQTVANTTSSNVQTGINLQGLVTTASNVDQLSPGSMSLLNLVNQFLNSEKQTEPSSVGPYKSGLLSSTQTPVFSKESQTNIQIENLIPVLQNSLPDLLAQKSSQTQPLTNEVTGENAPTNLNYQQLQNVISSLITGLQGQLDATRRLYSPPACLLATGSAIQPIIGQSVQDLCSANQLSDLPYSFVSPISQNVQVTCSTSSEHVHNSMEISRQDLNSQGEIILNSGIGNGMNVERVIPGETLESDGQLLSGEERLNESLMTEQSESMYEDQSFLYNKNLEPFLNSREDNSTIDSSNIDEGIVIGQVSIQHIAVDGCEEMTDGNTLKNQMLLSNDTEEDLTNVPNMFKHYCLTCKAAMFNDECEFHPSGYNHIKDTPILSKARTSIPSCLTLQPTSTFEYNAYLGVWTKESIPAQTKFGPMVGKLEKGKPTDPEVALCFPTWKVFLESHFETLDVSDENESNWMMFLKPARCEKTQNLIAHQLGHNIYFFTTKEVFCGQELLYWFSKEYATLSGYPSEPGDANLSECPNCGKMFVDHATRKLHMKDHPRNQKFKCHICDHSYSSLSSLKRHTLLHMGVKPHICNVCHKTFSDSSNLKVHLKLHTGMKVFSCNLCQREFRQKAHLKTHMLIHTGQKNLKCYFCDKTFAREGDRKQHEYQHTKEKSYTCEECEKVFYKLQNYKRHLLIHTGVRDFECEFCMKTFGRKYHLQRHLEKCHSRNEIFEEKDLILNNADLKRILNS